MGVALGATYADEGKLLSQWVAQYGLEGLAAGTVIVGDKLYGYRARLLGELEQAGWLPVMRVRDGLRQRVRSLSRLRAQARAEQFAWVLRGRHRIEQVLGSVNGAYGSYVSSRSWAGARSWVWGMWVLWGMVGVAQVVGGETVFVCTFVWLYPFSEHPQGTSERGVFLADAYLMLEEMLGHL